MARKRAAQRQIATLVEPELPGDKLYNPYVSTRSRLLSISGIPEWYGENPYIHSGYRPLCHAVGPCFRSWLYVHNQTANIFSHLIPGALALAVNVVFSHYFVQRYPDSTAADRLVFRVYLVTCSLCFGVSATYHTLLCHSHQVADLWLRLDYVSISILILGSFVPGLYLGFYCEPELWRGYLAMVSFDAEISYEQSWCD